MSTAKTDIKSFLESNLQDGLKGYFYENEKAERTIAENFVEIVVKVGENNASLDPPPLLITEEGQSYSVKITVYKPSAPATVDLSELSGQILRNGSRIESNFLTAIRKLIADKKNLWKDSMIRKVTVEVK